MKPVYIFLLLLSVDAFSDCHDPDSEGITRTVIAKQTVRTQTDGRLMIKQTEYLNKQMDNPFEPDTSDECLRSSEAGNAEASGTEDKRQVSILASGDLLLHYEFDQYALTQQHTDHIDEFISRNGMKTVVIEGHADHQGEDDYNNTLSYRRASEVKKYIEKNHSSSSVSDLIAYGESKPVCSIELNKIDGCNRRVIIYSAPPGT